MRIIRITNIIFWQDKGGVMIKKDKSFLYMYKLVSIFFISIIALTSVSAEEVNIYSARKGYLLEPLIQAFEKDTGIKVNIISCLLYTSPSPRDGLLPRMPSSA